MGLRESRHANCAPRSGAGSSFDKLRMSGFGAHHERFGHTTSGLSPASDSVDRIRERERVGAVGDRGHGALDALPPILLDEVAADLGVLVLVLDKDAALADRVVDAALIAAPLNAERAVAAVHGDVAG